MAAGDPHVVVLVFLWIAFLALSMVVFFAIVFTGRYPRTIFDFNVCVLRWTWRVSFHSYNALGTDRYPPFTLRPVPDYPATLEIDYPERLLRGLVLVKWWLLALPHYLVTGVFAGGAPSGTRPPVRRRRPAPRHEVAVQLAVRAARDGRDFAASPNPRTSNESCPREGGRRRSPQGHRQLVRRRHAVRTTRKGSP